MLQEIVQSGTKPHDFQVKIFGGGSQFAEYDEVAVNVATRNIDAGLELLAEHDLTVTSMHLGGTGHRQIALDIWSGDVWVQHVNREEKRAG
jgi:chemotaxis protein CheD